MCYIQKISNDYMLTEISKKIYGFVLYIIITVSAFSLS